MKLLFNIFTKFVIDAHRRIERRRADEDDLEFIAWLPENAECFGIPAPTADKMQLMFLIALAKADFLPPKPKQKRRKKVRYRFDARVIFLHDGGMSIRDIMAALELTRANVHRMLKEVRAAAPLTPTQYQALNKLRLALEAQCLDDDFADNRE